MTATAMHSWKGNCLLTVVGPFLRVTAVHAGWYAEPSGQQCGAHQAHGHGGGRVPELLHEYQWNQA